MWDDNGNPEEPKHQSWHTVGAPYVLAEGEKEGREGQEKQSGCQKSYKHELLAWSPRLTVALPSCPPLGCKTTSLHFFRPLLRGADPALKCPGTQSLLSKSRSRPPSEPTKSTLCLPPPGKLPQTQIQKRTHRAARPSPLMPCSQHNDSQVH